MKLSEAIRLGSMLKPQAFGMISHDGGTCAIGAAYDAVGIDIFHLRDSLPIAERAMVVYGKLPMLQTASECPVCGYLLEVGFVLTHLNDHHRWTREQIADWVETVELAVTERSAEPEAVAAVDPVAVSHPTGSTRVKGSCIFELVIVVGEA